MSFSKKILLAIFLTSGLLVLASILGTYLALKGSMTRSFENRYEAVSQNLGETIEKLERGTDDMMNAALLALKYSLGSKPIPSDLELRGVARDLKVSSIEIVQASGEFIRATHYDLLKLPNLFSFCPDYRDLFIGSAPSVRTPFMPSVVDRKVLKYALLPTVDRKHVINVGMDVTYLGELFHTMMAADSNLSEVGIYTPSGRALGVLARHGDTLEDVTGRMPSPRDGTLGTGEELPIRREVRSNVTQCCECIGKGLVSGPNEPFHYVLRAKVSLIELHHALERLAQTLLVASALALVFAYFVSRAIAAKLTSRLNRIHQATARLSDLKDLSVRLEVDGQDEIAMIGSTVDRLLERLQKEQAEVLKAERARATARMARDVVHNIGSSLTTIEANVPALVGIPEQIRNALRKAAREIRERLQSLTDQARMAEDQLPKAGPLKATRAVQLTHEQMLCIVKEVVDSRRSALHNRPKVHLVEEHDPDAYNLFAMIELDEFKAALTNILNNAVEAIPDSGTVWVRLTKLGSQCRVSVTDTGVGIAPEVRPHLGQRGQTFGKPQGSGLGLAHAVECLTRWNGSLDIDSDPGLGTTVTLEIPACSPPRWHLPAIELSATSRICVLDDYESIHHAWDLLLRQRGFAVGPKTISHCMTGSAFSQLVREHGHEFTDFWIDYELSGESASGLDLIERLGIADRSVLVTGRADEPQIQSRARFLGVRVLSKTLIAEVPIRVETALPSPGLQRGRQEPGPGKRVV